jgi:hypothetical protein
LRTYADAFEYDVAGGDLVGALTGGTPRVVALPNEPQGESIAYDRDGASLLTVSEVADLPAGTRAEVLRYPIAGRPAPSSPGPSAASGRRAPGVADGASSPVTAPRRVPLGAVATGVLLLGGAGVLGFRLARRRRR